MRKKFGQNFLINPAIRAKLLDALELNSGSRVWEIGPGLGAMTAGLLERGGRVTAFEIDHAFAEILRELFKNESESRPCAFDLVEGDVLKTWPGVMTDDELFLLGNLPYNIAAALLADFIEKGKFFKRMVVTVQREVAQRMAAKPGTADYSSFSVLCASVYQVSPVCVIKGSSFYPAPRVDSQGVKLELKTPVEKRPRYFYPLVRSLFSSRRKIIKNTLTSFASSVSLSLHSVKLINAGDAAGDALSRAKIAGERRPETLSLDEFVCLAACLEETIANG